MTLKLKMAFSENPRLQPLKDGTVRSEKIDLEVVTIPSQVIFYRNLAHGLEFDASEFSISETLLARERNEALGKGRWDWTPIPVFMSRGQFWADIHVNTSSGIEHLGDLRGKRIGVPDYVITAALWFKATLKELYGIEAWDNTWYNGRTKELSHAGALGFHLQGYGPAKGVQLHWLTVDQTMDVMLDRGELDAIIPVNVTEEITAGDTTVIDRYGGTPWTGNPRIRRLLGDQGKAVISEFFRRTGSYHANHHLVVRNTILRENPWVAMELYRTFQRSKEVGIRKGQKGPIGLSLFRGKGLEGAGSRFWRGSLPLGPSCDAKDGREGDSGFSGTGAHQKACQRRGPLLLHHPGYLNGDLTADNGCRDIVKQLPRKNGALSFSFQKGGKTMKRETCLLVGVLILAILFLHANLMAAPYYEGKKLTIIVGFEPGGGYDRLARLLARHLPKHIPGKPTIIVENMPGASSMISANYLYNIAKPDGLTICSFNQGIPFAQLQKAEGVKFDVMKFSWIGSAASEASVLTVRADLPYKTFDDLLKAKEPIALGSAGPGTQTHQFPILLQEFLGLKLKIVIYPSGTAVLLAVERKEVDCYAAFYNSLRPVIERGLVRPVIRGRVSAPGIENLPVDENLAADKKAKTIMAMRSATDEVGRPYVAPPKTPPEIMKTLREAFEKVGEDPELIADSNKLMMRVEYVSPERNIKGIELSSLPTRGDGQ